MSDKSEVEALGIPTKECPLSVLSYHEDGKCVAHALELDILGVGDTYVEAIKDMKELVSTQIQFAIKNHMVRSLWKPAPPEYQRLFMNAVRDMIENIGNKEKGEPDCYAQTISVPIPTAY